MNEYVTAAELKATLNLTGETFADADIDRARAAASVAIEKWTGRRFWLDPAPNNVRYYTPQQYNSLDIDDIAVVGSVLVDLNGDSTFSTAWANGSDYDLYPYNAPSEGLPYTRLELRYQSGNYPYLGRYQRSVRVTGQFGWPTVPADVTQATIILAARFLKRAREAAFGIATIGLDGAGVRISRIDPDVEFLISPYRRVVIA